MHIAQTRNHRVATHTQRSDHVQILPRPRSERAVCGWGVAREPGLAVVSVLLANPPRPRRCFLFLVVRRVLCCPVVCCCCCVVSPSGVAGAAGHSGRRAVAAAGRCASVVVARVDSSTAAIACRCRCARCAVLCCRCLFVSAVAETWRGSRAAAEEESGSESNRRCLRATPPGAAVTLPTAAQGASSAQTTAGVDRQRTQTNARPDRRTLKLSACSPPLCRLAHTSRQSSAPTPLSSSALPRRR